MIGSPGDYFRWTPETNLFLMTPATMVGVEVPSWWSRGMAMKHLGWTKEELTNAQVCATYEQTRIIELHQMLLAQLSTPQDPPVSEEEGMDEEEDEWI